MGNKYTLNPIGIMVITETNRTDMKNVEIRRSDL